jgi:hypothetical protein
MERDQKNSLEPYVFTSPTTKPPTLPPCPTLTKHILTQFTTRMRLRKTHNI